MASAGSVGPSSQGLCTFPRAPHQAAARAGATEGGQAEEHAQRGSTGSQERVGSASRGNEGGNGSQIPGCEEGTREGDIEEGWQAELGYAGGAMSRSSSSSSSSNSLELLEPLRPADVAAGAADVAGAGAHAGVVRDRGDAEVALQQLRNAVLGSRQGSRRHGRRCVIFEHYAPALRASAPPGDPSAHDRMRARREEALGCRAGTPLRYPLGPSSSAGEGRGPQGQQRGGRDSTGKGRGAGPHLHKVGTMPPQRARHASGVPQGGQGHSHRGVWEGEAEGGGAPGVEKERGADRGRGALGGAYRRWGLFGKMTLSFKEQSSSESLLLEDSPRGEGSAQREQEERGSSDPRGTNRQRVQGENGTNSPNERNRHRGHGDRGGDSNVASGEGEQGGVRDTGRWTELPSQEEPSWKQQGRVGANSPWGSSRGRAVWQGAQGEDYTAREGTPSNSGSATQRGQCRRGADAPAVPSAGLQDMQRPGDQGVHSTEPGVQNTQGAQRTQQPADKGMQNVQRAQAAAHNMPLPRRGPPFLTRQAQGAPGVRYILNPVVSRSDPFLRGPSTCLHQTNSPGPLQDSNSSGQPGSAGAGRGGGGGRGLLQSFKSWKEPRRLLGSASPAWGPVTSHGSPVTEPRRLLGPASPLWGDMPSSPLQPQEVARGQAQVRDPKDRDLLDGAPRSPGPQRGEAGRGQSQVTSRMAQAMESRDLLGPAPPSWGGATSSPVQQHGEPTLGQSQVGTRGSHEPQASVQRGGAHPSAAQALPHRQRQGQGRAKVSLSGPVLGARPRHPSAYPQSASAGAPSAAPPPRPLESPLPTTGLSNRPSAQLQYANDHAPPSRPSEPPPPPIPSTRHPLAYPKSASGGGPAPSRSPVLASAFPKSKSSGAATGGVPPVYYAGEEARPERGQERGGAHGVRGERDVITLEELIGDRLVRERAWKGEREERGGGRVWKSEREERGRERVWKSEREEGSEEESGSQAGLWESVRPALSDLARTDCSPDSTGERARWGQEGIGSTLSGGSVRGSECGSDGACEQHSQGEEDEVGDASMEHQGYASETPEADRMHAPKYASDSQEEALRARYAAAVHEGDQGGELLRYASELLDRHRPLKPMGPPKSLAHRRWASGIPFSSPIPTAAHGHPSVGAHATSSPLRDPSLGSPSPRTGTRLAAGRYASPWRPFSYRDVGARARLSEPARSFREAGGAPVDARRLPGRGYHSFREPGGTRGAALEDATHRREAWGTPLDSPGLADGGDHSIGEPGGSLGRAGGGAPRDTPEGGKQSSREAGASTRRVLLSEGRQAGLGLGGLRKSPRGGTAERPKLGARMDLDEFAFKYYAQDGRGPGAK